MLILEDTKHNKIAPLPNAKDVKIERDLQGNDTLSFSYAMGIDDFYSSILPQCFIVTPDQEYVIKEVNPGEENYADVVAVVNTEDLKSLYNNAFTRTDVKLSEIATNALVGSGWTFQSDVTKLRSLSMTNSTALDILKKLAETYMCDINFDAKNKIVTFKDTIGSETEGQGVYFIDKLNLVGLEVQSNTYDFCTRLIPVGQDNLYITDVNAGLPYVENYQYCNQIVVAYWDANQYTDKNALKADAIEKLKVLSTPTVAYKANVRDLANLMPNQYKFLNYKLGDFVRIRDNQKQIEENVRIVKTTDYPFEPENNQVELNSRYEQLEDIELKHEQTDNTVSSITTPDGGGINGDTVDKIDWTKVQNVQVQTAQIEDAAITNAKIANATITSAQIQDATIITAKIGDLQVTNEKVANLSADKIAAGTIDANKINVINIDASQISTGFLNADRILAGSLDANKIKTHSITADSAIIADAAINTAQIADLSVTNAKIANATITGAKIEVATIETANIKNAAITTALIDVGAVNTQQVADGSITDAKIVSLTANKITAGIIDAGVINVVNLNADNITVGKINGQYIANGAITDDKIANDTITKAKISKAFVDDLDATYATIINLNVAVGRINTLETNSATITDLQTTNGNITNLTSDVATIQTLVNGNITSANMTAGAIQAGDATIANGAISSAQIISLDVAKLNAGNISTNKFVVTSDSGNLKIQGNTLHVWDNDGKERISLGLNGTDYNLLVRGADGTTVLFGTDGVTHAGITNGAVDDSKVATNANISGGKIEKESLVTQINGATTTLKSSKIKFDDTGQTLDVAFTSLKNTVTDTANTVSSQGTTISAVQGDISSKIWQTDITGAIDAMQVGGTNLLLNSNFIDGMTNWAINHYSGSTVSSNIIHDDDLQKQVLQVITSSGSSDSCARCGWFKVKPNTQYTFSYNWVCKSNNPVMVEYFIMEHTSITKPSGSSYTSILKSGIYNPLTSPYNVITFTTKSDTQWIYIRLDNNGSNDTGQNIMELYEVKVEEGNKATAWSPAPEDVQGQITTINQNYSTLSQTVGGITSTVGSLQTSLDSTNSNVTSVASRVSTVEQSVNGLSSTITSVQQNYLKSSDASSTYATQTSVSSLNQTVSSLSSAISSDYLKKDDAGNTYATQSTVSTLQQDLNGFSSTLSSVQTDVSKKAYSTDVTSSINSAIDAINIGGTNLFKNSNFYKDIDNNVQNGWYDFNSSVVSYGTGYNGINRSIIISVSSNYYRIQQDALIKPNSTYTISFMAKGTFNIFAVGMIDINMGSWNPCQDPYWDFNTSGNYSSWQKFSKTINTQSNAVRVVFIIQVNAQKSAELTEFKLEEGNKATAWSPAPEDVQGQIDTVNGTISSIQSTISTQSSSITQLQNSISSKVESSTFTSYKNSNDSNISSLQSRMSSAEQKITSDAIVSTVRSSTSYTNDLTGKVSTNEIISTINQSAETVAIDASKINLNGYVTFSSLQAGGGTYIDGGQITTGYIDSDRIESNSINVDKLVVGADFTNYFPNPTLNPSLGNPFTGVTTPITNTNPSTPYVAHLRGRDHILGRVVINCKPGDTFTIEADVWRGGSLGSQTDNGKNLNAGLWLRKNGTSAITPTPWSIVGPSNSQPWQTWTHCIWNYTVGSGGVTGTDVVTSGLVYFQIGQSADISTSTNIDIAISNIYIRKKVGTTLIADGAITTDKIVADAITADKIDSHTITANEIASNTITAAQMATGTITASSGIISSIDASKITTGTLSGDRIYGGTITGALLKTSNTSNYMYLHDQYIDFYKNGSRMAVIGYDQSADNQYLYPKLSLFNNGNEYTVGMYRDNKLWSDINYFPTGVTFNGGLDSTSNITTNGLTSYDDISAMYNIEAMNGTITAGNGFRGLGRRSAYSESVSISTGSSEYIYHYLGYYPIVVLSGTIGNVIVTYVHQSSSCLRVYCYSGGGATWNGVVYLY